MQGKHNKKLLLGVLGKGSENQREPLGKEKQNWGGKNLGIHFALLRKGLKEN